MNVISDDDFNFDYYSIISFVVQFGSGANAICNLFY